MLYEAKPNDSKARGIKQCPQFSVYLKCKREDLERHDKFVDDKSRYPEEDLKNHNFQIEKR